MTPRSFAFLGQYYLELALTWGFVLVALTAFILALSTRPAAYQRADKRTQPFWLLITGLGLLGTWLGASAPLGLGILICGLLGVMPGAVFLADVWPQVRRRRSR